MPLSVIFMGTPDYAAHHLEKIIDSPHQIKAVYTQPPRPAGKRGLKYKKSIVQEISEKNNIKVLNPINFKSHTTVEEFKKFQADVAIVVAYGLILPKNILIAPKFGCFNAHASLLPRWRGAAPINRAIMAGDSQTGVMIIKMNEGLDTGPIAMTEQLSLIHI